MGNPRVKFLYFAMMRNMELPQRPHGCRSVKMVKSTGAGLRYSLSLLRKGRQMEIHLVLRLR